MLSIIISTIIGGLLVPFVLIGLKLVFNIGSFSLRATLIPIKHFIGVVLRWGKFIAIPVGLLMLMHPKEFSVANGALAEKLGLIILIIGAIYTLRACFRGFTQIAAVAAWCAVSLVGVHFYGQQKVIDHIVSASKSESVSTINFVPFADPKRSILHSKNCVLDCLEEISFVSDKKSSRNIQTSQVGYFLDSSKKSVVDQLDSTYKTTLDQSSILFGSSSSNVPSLPEEAFFGRAPSGESTGSTIMDQGKQLLSFLF